MEKLVIPAFPKKSRYDAISDNTATATAHDNEEVGSSAPKIPAEHQPFIQRSVSHKRRPGPCTVCLYFVRQNFAAVVIAVLLSIIFAMAGNRASSKGQAEQTVLNERIAGSIDRRPCEIYNMVHKGTVEILQTSLGTPSSHWSEIPCSVRDHEYRFKEDGLQWRWRFRNHDEPVDYGRPSAEIRVQPEDIAHPERSPILGFGGAFTEATALNYMSLNESGRSAVIDLLFGKDGLGYSLGRVHINSCDFSVNSYSFDDVDGDFDLDHFDMDVKHDVKSGMVAMMLKANDIALKDWSEEGEHGMRIIASPWSPPAWMKKPTGDDSVGADHASSMTGSAQPNCLREGTGPESKYAKTWALYFGKFISAYKNLGISLWAITVQNEPEFPAPWEACSYTAGIESSFIANHLGPQLSESHPDVKLFIFDHNKDHAPHWADIIMNQTNEAAKYVDGTSIHWYAGGMDRLLDGAVGQPNMHRLISKLKYMGARPDHLVLGSEACHCPSTGYAGGDLKVAWARAERYAHTILADLAAGSNGWVEWNLILDAIGGPNHLNNVCDSPLLAVPYRAGGKSNITDLPKFEHADYPFGPVAGDARTQEELNAEGYPAEYLDVGVVVQPMYYYMGHISRYVRPDSRSVLAIVGSSAHSPGHRTFLHHLENNRTLAGGGINDLARRGVEVTVWPCEGSTRQHWTLNEVGYLQVFGHDWLGTPTVSCLGKEPDESFKGLILTDCDRHAGLLKIKEIDNPVVNSQTQENGMINFVFENSRDAKGSTCLIISPLENEGGAYGPLGGAQVTTGSCADPMAVWYFDEERGEILSSFFSPTSGGEDVCLTTGWPFLQVGAFFTPNGVKEKTVVILNEASEPANYILRNYGEVFLTNSIPAHSIQTVLYD